MAAGRSRLDADFLPTDSARSQEYVLCAIGADVELTAAGRDSLITRIEEDPAKNVERWKKLPYV